MYAVLVENTKPEFSNFFTVKDSIFNYTVNTNCTALTAAHSTIYLYLFILKGL